MGNSISIIEKLKQRFPSGFVGGRAVAIVGPLGLDIRSYNLDLTQNMWRLKENDFVYITTVSDNAIEISKNGEFGNIKVGLHHFKSFQITNWQ